MRLRPRDAATILLIGLSCPVAAQDGEAPPAVIPRLAENAPSAEGFAPRGWIVEAKAGGDLDRDGLEDLAFVLHGTDPALLVKTHQTEPLDTNPRILGVAAGRAGGGFRLVAQNATLIPRHVEANLLDPFEASGLSIARGAVIVTLTSFATMGGWGAADVRFTFRLADGKLRAIGFDRTDTQRNTGRTTTTSVNYLTGRKSVAEGSIEDDESKPTKKVWSKVATPGPEIGAIGDGLMFGIER